MRSLFEEAGLDLDRLSRPERVAVAGYDGDQTPDAVADFVEQNGLPLAARQAAERDVSPAEVIARAARNSHVGSDHRASITPDDAAKWSVEKTLDFIARQPDKWDELTRGRTVNGVR
jgi:hypothetical protein